MFFQYNAALGPPYHILVDTNFINFSIQNKLELVKSMMDCLYAKCMYHLYVYGHVYSFVYIHLSCTMYYGLCIGRIGEIRAQVSYCAKVSSHVWERSIIRWANMDLH